MKQKFFVLSMDAMVWEDIAYLQTKPNFSEIMKHMSGVKRITTIYPSITYPAHVSIGTGCYCGKHGVYTNHTFDRSSGKNFAKGDWHYTCDPIKVDTFFEAAKKAGLTTASVYWPVTGNNKNIDYLIDEYFFPIPEETPEQGFTRMGSNEDALKVVRDNLDRWPVDYNNRAGMLKKTNTYDDFIMGCCCSMIKRYQPDFLAAHNCMMDTLRHRFGIFNEYVTKGLDMTDEWLGEVIAAMKEAGVYEDTNFIILSDHGQMDFTRRVKMNVLLRRGGFLDVDEHGIVTDWKASSQSCGMSAAIRVRRPEYKQEVYEYLCKLHDEEVWGVGEVLTEEQIKTEYGYYGDIDFVVETDGYTAYADSWQEPLINPVDLSDYRLGAATHGYRPEKGPKPIFLCAGPAFKQDVLHEEGPIINDAPTIVAAFGGKLPEADGRALTDIIK